MRQPADTCSLSATSSGVVRPEYIEPVPQPPHACDNKPKGFTCSVTVKLYVIAGGGVDRVEIVELLKIAVVTQQQGSAPKYRFAKEINRIEYTTTIDPYTCGI